MCPLHDEDFRHPTDPVSPHGSPGFDEPYELISSHKTHRRLGPADPTAPKTPLPMAPTKLSDFRGSTNPADRTNSTISTDAVDPTGPMDLKDPTTLNEKQNGKIWKYCGKCCDKSDAKT